MTLEEIKKEAELLTFADQGKLAAFVVSLRNRQDPAYKAEIQRRLNDTNSSHWLTPDQFEARK